MCFRLILEFFTETTTTIQSVCNSLRVRAQTCPSGGSGDSGPVTSRCQQGCAAGPSGRSWRTPGQCRSPGWPRSGWARLASPAALLAPGSVSSAGCSPGCRAPCSRGLQPGRDTRDTVREGKGLWAQGSGRRDKLTRPEPTWSKKPPRSCSFSCSTCKRSCQVLLFSPQQVLELSLPWDRTSAGRFGQGRITTDGNDGNCLIFLPSPSFEVQGSLPGAAELHLCRAGCSRSLCRIPEPPPAPHKNSPDVVQPWNW